MLQFQRVKGRGVQAAFRMKEGQALRLLRRPFADVPAILEAATHDAYHHKSEFPHFNSHNDPGYNSIADPQNINWHLPAMQKPFPPSPRIIPCQVQGHIERLSDVVTGSSARSLRSLQERSAGTEI